MLDPVRVLDSTGTHTRRSSSCWRGNQHSLWARIPSRHEPARSSSFGPASLTTLSIRERDVCARSTSVPAVPSSQSGWKTDGQRVPWREHYPPTGTKCAAIYTSGLAEARRFTSSTRHRDEEQEKNTMAQRTAGSREEWQAANSKQLERE